MQTSAIKSVCSNTILDKATEFLTHEGLLPVDSEKYIILPGLCDVHVHFREPGFSYKETIASGSSAAAAGGYTAVCTMPNLDPVPDSVENLSVQLDIIKKDACIKVLPYGAITVGEKGEVLADIDGMSPYVCGFSDDGRGVQSDEMMLAAMKKAKELDKVIAAHCEVNSLLNGGYIHDGEYARIHGHKGICSASEYEQIARDLELAAKTGVKYHVCHISAKESVEIIRQAKKSGVDVTCETGPHYLTMCDMDLKENGRFKMNPPLRSQDDKEALVQGILDGTIDMIATDHAPHSVEEKSKGLEKSLMGVAGLETAFAVMYTEFVKKGTLSVERLAELMSVNPRKRFGIDVGDGFTVFEVVNPYVIEPEKFVTLGRATPFAGKEIFGKCIITVHDGRVVYRRNKNEG